MKKELIVPDSYKYISAFITMRCNLNCSFCLNAFDKEFNRSEFEEISGEQWVEGLNRIVSRPNVPISFCGGEPFLHKDFISIINNLRPDLNIDILTNLQWGDKGIEKFISQVNPDRIKRDSPYASIRVSYHPEQMDGLNLAKKVKRMKDARFSIGIWSVLYPSPETLSAINQMQFICKDFGIDFRLKEYTGKYKGEIYGDYSKYHGAVFSNRPQRRLCKTSELLIGPNGNVYGCHRDLYAGESPRGNILAGDFEINTDFIDCEKFGECHPCDVKVKTDYRQKFGYTSVQIKKID